MFSVNWHRMALAFVLLMPLAEHAEAQGALSPELRAQIAAMREKQAKLPDTKGTGQYPALKEETPSLPDHVVYRPADLSRLRASELGVYVFGNGACTDDGASSRLHLLEVASHGYLAIAPGRVKSGPGVTTQAVPDAPPPAGGPPKIPPPATSHTALLEAIDWALAQNQDRSSPYFGKIDAKAIAVSGYSCGGLQALQVAPDPRVKTVIIMNSGIFNDGGGAIPGMNLSKQALASLHTPTLYILGGETDIAYKNGMDDFARINRVPVFVGNILGVGHGGTYWDPNGGKAAAAVVAWLDWQLRGDRNAAKTFVGADCVLCRDKAWSIERKQLADSR